jgi:tetratricopeptide (TPR) repeat protein
VLTFFFTGVFFASLHRENVLRTKEISFSEYPRASFAIVLLFVLAMLLSLALGYTVAQKFVSAYYFNNGIIAYAQNNQVDVAENYMLKAISLEENDVYYRGISGLQIVRLGNIVSSVTGTQVSDEVKNEFQRVLGNAISAASKSIELDGTNYQNWVALGKVYDAVTPLGIDKAYENATQSYEEAIKRSPANPELYLMLARLETSKRDFKKAKDYIAKALAQKENFSEAIFLRSQIEVAEGNIRGAVASVEGIALISPNDAGVFFELGLLKYNNKDFLGASRALERAVALIPEYANAKYFLGLSYDKLGRRAEAILQFKDISMLNPGNQEVTLILSNLNSGRGPFTNAEPPLDDKPEKRSKLPIGEDNN